MSVCLFCKTEGVFQTKEHIVPESLGNDTDVLKNTICAKCQNYLGREVEKPALEKTNIAFWRSYLGIRTKKRHLPSVNLDPLARGAIPAFHPKADIGVGFTAHEDGSTSMDVDNPEFMNKLFCGNASKYLMVLSPWYLSMLGRFLGKVGLEYVCLADPDRAFGVQFDPMRAFIRYGSTKHLWPIYWGQQGSLDELKDPIVQDGPEGHQEILCYRYALGEIVETGDMIFTFSIGIDIMAICLTSSLPIPAVEECVTGVKLSCVHYADGTW